jgi:hypothetical protein
MAAPGQESGIGGIPMEQIGGKISQLHLEALAGGDDFIRKVGDEIQ